MISDALTARVIGLVMILFVLLMDISITMFSRVPGTSPFPFAIYVSAPSIPFLVLGGWLIARAKRFDKS